MPDSSEWDGVVFAGTKQSQREFNRAHHIDETPEEAKKVSDDKTVKPKTVLSKDTLKELDEESLRILKRTRCANDYLSVYMQSSLDFYDRYYNETNVSPELKAARQIRRMYRSYDDYLVALNIRTAYLDSLVDKYGEDEFLKKLQMGILQDWIPPMPLLSKNAEDYDLFKAGLSPMAVCETLPDEAIDHLVEKMQEDFEGTEIDDMGGTETSFGMIREIVNMEESTDRQVNVSDLEELAREFKSWYKADAKAETGKEMFKNAPENIMKRFLEQRPYMHPGLLDKIMCGEIIEDELINLNESVRDEKLGRTMSRGELMRRETIRVLADAGWSESRLLKYQEVGSSLARTARKRKPRRKRSGNGVSNDELVNFMNAPDGIDPIYADSEELLSAFDGLMRGD